MYFNQFYWSLLLSSLYFLVSTPLLSSPLLRRSWWSPPSLPPSCPPPLLLRPPPSPPPSRSLPRLSPPPPSSLPPPRPSPLPFLSILALQPPHPSLQPPSCARLLDQSERAKDRFSSRRTDDLWPWTSIFCWYCRGRRVQKRQLCHQGCRNSNLQPFDLTETSKREQTPHPPPHVWIRCRRFLLLWSENSQLTWQQSLIWFCPNQKWICCFN